MIDIKSECANLTPAPNPGKPVREVAAFLSLCPAGVLLGLDPGSRTIGVAASDATRMIATPVEVIRRKGWQGDLARLKQLADARSAAGVVLGWPLDMNGDEGPRAQSARQTGTNLVRGLGLPVLLWDERLSTFEAEDILHRQGRGRIRKGTRIDDVAAAVILRDALQAMART